MMILSSYIHITWLYYGIIILLLWSLYYPGRCARNPPPCRIFISWILEVLFLGFSWFWVTRFSWFWVFLEARGLFFWWFLNILGDLGAIGKVAWIFVIFRTFPPRKPSPFWSHFWYLLHLSFSVFFSVCFFCFFVILGAQRLHFGRLFCCFLQRWATGKWKRIRVFGLHRRVRIAYPGFRKNDFPDHFWCFF